MKESRQEQQRKAEGNLSELEGSKESAINGKQKDSGQKETPVVSATMGTNAEHRRAHRLSYTEPETQNDGKTSSQGNFLRGRSPSGKRNRRPCKDDITGKCTNPSCDSWHPAVCQNYKTESSCKFDEKCSFVHRVDCQPNTNLKRIVAKVLLPF